MEKVDGYQVLPEFHDSAVRARDPVPLSKLVRQLAPIGFLSFGGTQANMALFYSLFVGQLGWVSAEMYADLLAMAQSLPGPSAMQVLMTASSVSTHTFMGGVLAFLLFSIPCAILFAWLGVHVSQIPNCTAPAALGCAAIAVVASGAIQLKTKLVKDKLTEIIWMIACVTAILCSSMPEISSYGTLAALITGGILSLLFGPAVDATTAQNTDKEQLAVSAGVSKGVGAVLFCGAWVSCVVAMCFPDAPVAIFYRVGALVFGGGPIVIPLLLLHLVAAHLITTHQFLLGFAVANVCPGPMFNIAAFLGGLIGGYTGALTAWLALFTPGVLMQFGALPFWAIVRHNGKVRKVLTGVNAAAAGLMAAAVVIIWVTIVTSMQRAGLTVALIGGREIVKLPAYNVIMIGMIASAIFYFSHIPF